MVWEIEIRKKDRAGDRERERVLHDYALLTHGVGESPPITHTTRGYLVSGDVSALDIERLAGQLLVDGVVETVTLRQLESKSSNGHENYATVLLKPGVMDPVAESVLQAAHDLKTPLKALRTFRRYHGAPQTGPLAKQLLYKKVLANDAIEELVEGALAPTVLADAGARAFAKVTVPLRTLDDAALLKLSRDGQLALSLDEMKTIQRHFAELGREPTDVELETLAQTWSEHCSHKTLKGLIDFDGVRIDNVLKSTIFAATQEIRRRLGPDDWCVSVFADNAGIVKFDDRFNVCFKVETHNHPSAIEPYGGANTGLGGVIRDVLGTGLSAKPICNTDVFCFASPEIETERLPPGVLPPRSIIRGVVAGVRDYGNRIGIPTVNGAVCFDDRYLANPLVFCGTVGLIPADKCHKAPMAGDLIVALGGRTGRDGIHGATFSSIELSAASETISGGAVQIGNPITEKKLLDVILVARDRGLFNAVTDCGAGGFSSAVGEMGEHLGAEVWLHKAPLKYAGLTYMEIWISESQERMVLAVPPTKWEKLQALCAGENVEATIIGKFEATGKLRLFYEDNLVGDLGMSFLHNGRPPVVRKATRPLESPPTSAKPTPQSSQYSDDLVKILAAPNVRSKEWIIRQYDHEVQGATVIKPLVGEGEEGPGDAAVVTPVLGSFRGLAIGCGINPLLGDIDAYAMAACVIDEAVRNVVAVGADPSRVALLDNFCWANTERPEVLGSLCQAAQACHDVALAFGTPFISGKDSLNNEFRSGSQVIAIPPTLLISAMGIVPDVRRAVTMDLKEPGNLLYLVGATRNEIGGSHYHLIHGVRGSTVPKVDLQLAPLIFQKVHEAINQGFVRSCHDLSEGGLAVAVAEMTFAGGLGADLTGAHEENLPDEAMLFAESPSRFLVEVRPDNKGEFETTLGGQIPHRLVGQTIREPRLRIAGKKGEWIIWAHLAELKKAWQTPTT